MSPQSPHEISPRNVGLERPVRLRFAPSPTGYLHVGGARTALFNWLYAKKVGGKFILRIEDTDQARSTEEALQMQLGDLNWLGLAWDEGPQIGGKYGPYKQSERLSIYKKHADQLIDQGKAYWCFCTDKDLEAKKEIALKEGRPPHYDGTCRNLSQEEVSKRRAAGERSAVRFLVRQQGSISFKDIIRDNVSFPEGMVGDFIILRSDGMPVYNFCCVIDDALMEISHVLRAEEHLSNTLRQIMLYNAFDYQIPEFGHLSIILGRDRQKLSKRHGATSCNEYRRSGYLPQALKNFIALLGWSAPSGEEIMTEKRMIEQFGLDRFHSAAAVFDEVKLKWMNAQYLRALPINELELEVTKYLKDSGYHLIDGIRLGPALGVLKSSMETFGDAITQFAPFMVGGVPSAVLPDEAAKAAAEVQEVKSWPSTTAVALAWTKFLESFPEEYLSESDFMGIQDKIKNETGAKGKFLFQALRLCVLGKAHGAELKLIVPCLPRKWLLEKARQIV